MFNPEKMALKLSNNKPQLKERLLEARSVLADWALKYFKSYRYDFENKRLTGTDGYYLQWQLRNNPNIPVSYENQQTTKGIVVLRKDGYTWN